MAERDSEWYDEPKYEDALELGTSMLEAYVREYGKDDQWLVLAVEQPFRIKVSNGGKPVAYFNSTFDLVYRDLDDGLIYLDDHKTASQVQTAYLELDPQAGAYWAVASKIGRAKGWLGPDEVIHGIMYNILRKAMEDPRPRDEQGRYLNINGSVSKRQPTAPFLRHMVERSPEELRTEMQSLADDVVYMNAMRDGGQPVRKVRTKECTFCDFFSLCKMQQRGNHESAQEYARAQYAIIDPYLRYKEKSASE
jgi:hypothetical protein